MSENIDCLTERLCEIRDEIRSGADVAVSAGPDGSLTTVYDSLPEKHPLVQMARGLKPAFKGNAE